MRGSIAFSGWRRYLWAYVLFLPFLMNSCTSRQANDLMDKLNIDQAKASGIVIDYPLNGTIFPPEFPPAEFLWHDANHSSAKWMISVTCNQQEIYRKTLNYPSWRPDSGIWAQIRDLSNEQPVRITLVGLKKDGQTLPSGSTTFSFSKDPVGASIFYRAVPLPFGYAVRHVNEIEWYAGTVDGSKPVKVLDHIPVCANCHSFSANGTMAMDVDYANDKGSYIISTIQDTVHLTLDKIITWSNYKRNDGELTFGLLSQISGDGRYVLSTVKDRSIFVEVDNLAYSQLFFPVKGIIAVYDRNNKQFTELKGACDKKYVQSNPSWSPDCKEVLFARAERFMSSKIDNSSTVLLKTEDAQEFIKRQKDFKFDIYRVPFNEGKGGVAQPLQGASGDHKSNFFPKYSPDGKWIVFCKADNFMLLQPDSKLYIMPATGGEPRLMNCNTGNMNSWHSWSPNGRWLVFSSKNNGPYTQLYLTHIDENGQDSPPVFLENLAFDKRAANIPEFFENDKFGLKRLTDNFSKNAIYYYRLASLATGEKQYSDALSHLQNALKSDSTLFDAYEERMNIHFILRQSGCKSDLKDRKMAARLIDAEIKKNPDDASLYIKRGHLRLLTGNYEGALSDGLIASANVSNRFKGYELIADTYEQNQNWDKALSYLQKMLALQPDNLNVIYDLAIAYQNMGHDNKALELFNQIIKRVPNSGGFLASRASLYIKMNNMQAAKADFDRSVSVDPGNYIGYRERGAFFYHSSSVDMAMKDFNTALSLLDKEIKRNPQDATLYFSHAEIMEKVNMQNAVTEYENILKLWPLNHYVLKKLGQERYSAKQYASAIAAYSTIIDNFPQDDESLCTRGIIYFESGNPQKALTDLNKAIAINSSQYIYYYFRSNVENQLGDRKAHVDDLKICYNLLQQSSKKRNLNPKEEEILAIVQKEI